MLAIIIITQISRRTQHFPPSLWRSTRTGMREIPVAAEFHPADTDFLYYSLSNSQSDALNEIPRGHYWSCEVSNGATAVMWFRSKNLFFNWKKKPQPTQDLWKTHDLDCSEVKYAEVSAPKLPEARLGGALRNLASWKMSLPTAVVLELYDLWSFLPTQTTLWCWWSLLSEWFLTMITFSKASTWPVLNCTCVITCWSPQLSDSHMERTYRAAALQTRQEK